jgi:hypothetical protein
MQQLDLDGLKETFTSDSTPIYEKLLINKYLVEIYEKLHKIEVNGIYNPHLRRPDDSTSDLSNVFDTDIVKPSRNRPPLGKGGKSKSKKRRSSKRIRRRRTRYRK